MFGLRSPVAVMWVFMVDGLMVWWSLAGDVVDEFVECWLLGVVVQQCGCLVQVVA